MKYENVISSSIHALGYDSETSTMGVIFTNGAEYHYKSVDLETFERVKTANSIGKAFDLLVKKAGFAFERIK
jgi:hypothetical protein